MHPTRLDPSRPKSAGWRPKQRTVKKPPARVQLQQSPEPSPQHAEQPAGGSPPGEDVNPGQSADGLPQPDDGPSTVPPLHLSDGGLSTALPIRPSSAGRVGAPRPLSARRTFPLSESAWFASVADTRPPPSPRRPPPSASDPAATQQPDLPRPEGDVRRPRPPPVTTPASPPMATAQLLGEREVGVVG